MLSKKSNKSEMKMTRLCNISGCTYPGGECSGECYHPDERRMDIIGQNGGDGAHYDAVNPSHYKSHASGIECIQVTEHMTFCIGNAIKYLWRVGLKGDGIEDLRKAAWYIDREIKRRSKNGN